MSEVTEVEAAYYTVEEAAKLLKVSPQTVYRAVETNQIRSIRVLNAIRIPKDFTSDLQQQPRVPTPEAVVPSRSRAVIRRADHPTENPTFRP